MKLIISILTFPLVLALSVTGLFALYASSMIGSSVVEDGTAFSHFLKGTIYVSIGCGLPLAVLTALLGAALMICSFIFKSWTRALVTGGLGFLAVLIWLYFLSIPFPI